MDIDGRQPDWGTHVDRTIAGLLDQGGPLSSDDRCFLHACYYQRDLDPARARETQRIAALLWG